MGKGMEEGRGGGGGQWDNIFIHKANFFTIV